MLKSENIRRENRVYMSNNMLTDIIKTYQKQRTEKRLAYFRELRRGHENHELNPVEEIREYASDILKSEKFISSGNNIQHGNMSVRKHSLQVAKYSLIIADRFGIQVDRRQMVRGALLHDYFLYDWHGPNHNLHGFYHPGVALKKAQKDFRLTDMEKDIIKKHMWPMTVIPPRYKEAWVVTSADKYCSAMETLGIHRGSSVKQKDTILETCRKKFSGWIDRQANKE